MSVLVSLLSVLSAAAQEPTASPADDPSFSDVIIVWPDKFARWKDTRWFVATEIVVPLGMVFGLEENHEFRTFAWQVKAVFHCNQDYKLNGKKIEVGCTIEDVGLQATTIDRFRRERDRAIVQEVLDSLDRRLTGAKIQLQVNDRGAVTNLDLEGIDTRNLRERLQAETLRLICGRMLVPFHMKIPKSGMVEGQWVEFDSQLMSMPSRDGWRGNTTLVHYLNFYKGHLLVQDIGEGHIAVTPPAGGDGYGGPAAEGGAASAGAAPDTLAGLGIGTPSGWPEEGLAYRLRMDGVAVYNVDNGVMEERVWSMRGVPSASNPTTLNYWYAGRIQLLGERETRDVGPTRQVSYPGVEIEGLPVWLPADPEIAETLGGFRPPMKKSVPAGRSR